MATILQFPIKKKETPKKSIKEVSPADLEFAQRLERIKISLNNINKLMSELRKLPTKE